MAVAWRERHVKRSTPSINESGKRDDGSPERPTAIRDPRLPSPTSSLYYYFYLYIYTTVYTRYTLVT